MNTTHLFSSKRLEKTILELIVPNQYMESGLLGDWTATLIYLKGKKGWLVMNNDAKYSLLLSNIKKADLPNINTIFKQTLLIQLKHEGIEVDSNLIEEHIGNLEFHPTNNNQRVNGHINSQMFLLKVLMSRIEYLKEIHFREMNMRLNKTPMETLKWSDPREVMRKTILAHIKAQMER